MIAYKESPFVLTSSAGENYREEYAQLMKIAARYAVPLQVWAPEPQAVSVARTMAKERGIHVIVAGHISAPESSNGLEEHVQEMAQASPDLLYTRVFGTIEELRRVAAIMSTTRLPFALALALHEYGAPALSTVIAEVDADPLTRPWHYVLGCISPKAARAALESLFRSSPALAHRVVAFEAQGYSLTPEAFASEVWEVARDFGLHVLGGCCGTDATYIEALAAAATNNRA